MKVLKLSHQKNMKYRLKSLENGLDQIQTIYDRMDKTSDLAINQIMPCLGDSFPDGETEGICTLGNLGGKAFGDLTQLVKVCKDNGKYRVIVKTFTMDWEDLPFIEKPKVLTWIKEILEKLKPSDGKLLKTGEILQAMMSEINECLAEISEISDKLIKEILPQPEDSFKINENAKEEEAVSLFLEEFEHPEPVIQIWKSGKGNNVTIQTTNRTLNWTDLPPLEKSFLLDILKKKCIERKCEV